MFNTFFASSSDFLSAKMITGGGLLLAFGSGLFILNKLKRIVYGNFVPRELWLSSRLEDQVVIVTGTTKGSIGFETAKALYLKGAVVVMAMRDLKQGEENIEQLKKEAVKGDSSRVGKLIVMELNLDDLDQVKEFCVEFKKRFDRLDIMINNAGVGCNVHGVTRQNFELLLGVNHLGHFLMVYSLIGLMEETCEKTNKPGRIINVSSLMHLSMNRSDISELFEKKYFMKGSCENTSTISLYHRSKFCNVLLSKYVHSHYFDSGTKKIASYSVNPGAVSTNIYRNFPTVIVWFVKVLGFLIMKTPKSGAQTQIYLALENFEKLQSGGYYDNCHLATEHNMTNDTTLATKLWNMSKELCGL